MATDYGSVDKVEQAKNLAILRREEAQDEQPRPTAFWIALSLIVFFGCGVLSILLMWGVR